jgi:prepilin-type N-terminal cleavage/methylation domain-containing protein
MHNNAQSGKSGFTLIELLVVISIIGLLASVVLVSINSARRKSRDTKRIADMNQMAKAMELYFNTNNVYPPQATYIPLDTVAGLTPNYVATLPKAPAPADGVCSAVGAGTCTSANTYCYTGSGNVFTITFCLGDSIGGLQSGVRYLTPGGFK